MKHLFALAVGAGLLANAAFAADPGYEKNLDTALQTARTQNKMVFVLYGRDSLSACENTKTMIKMHQINVTPSKYVLVDLDCGDKRIVDDFHKHFPNEKFTRDLPFVVVTDSNGKVVASNSGGLEALEWNNFLRNAVKKAGANGGSESGSGSTDPNWPFKGAAPPR